MAADFNLTNQYISQSFQQLMQISSSNTPTDGTGSVITNLSVTASNATNALTASLLLGSITSASYAQTATSASHAVQADSALSADSVTSASYAATASVVTGTITSASHAVQADNAQDANDLVVQVKNTQASTIVKGQVLHATGVTGEVINVITASNDIAANMPAFAVANENISSNASGQAIVSGKIVGIDTSGLVAGANVYVNLNGDYTGTKPTGSGLIQNIGVVGKVNATEGELVVLGAGRSNDLPNLTEDYVWKGDSNGVPQAVASSSIIPTTANTASYVAAANIDGTVATATSASHAVRADVADDLASTARINITDITASNASFTSASVGYLKTVTGSATIIVDEYIILNADSPTQRYAGIKVYDSGSGLTGSFEWDSVDDNWMQVATDGTSAGFLTAISGSKGSEAYPTANTLIKGTGNHTVKDSSIVDNGTNVTTNLPISASGGITGSLLGTASFAQDFSGIFTGSAKFTGSLTVEGDTLLDYKTAPNFAAKEIIKFPAFTKSASPGNGVAVNYNAMLYRNIPVAGAVNGVFQIGQGFDSNFDTYGSYLNVGNSRSELYLLASGSSGGLSTAQRSADIAVLDNGDDTYEGNATARYYGTTIELGLYNSRDILLGNGFFGGTGYDTRTITIGSETVYIGAAPGQTLDWGATADLAYSGNPTKDIEFWYTGSAIFHQTSSIVAPAIVVSGSAISSVNALTISSNTASIDCNTGDLFTLTLVSGSNTHLNTTNLNPGQTISLKVTQPTTATDSYGTMTFDSEFAFAGGTAPTITAASGSIDILTFQSFDSTTVFGTSVQNLS